MSSDYFLYTDQQYGPYDESALKEHLAQGRFNRDSWIFRNGETPDWTKAAEVASLKTLFLPTETPSKAVSLADRLKQATIPAQSSQHESFGTMLVPKSGFDGVKNLQPTLPQAPLSDIPKQEIGSNTTTSVPSSEKVGFFGKLKKLFRR